MMAKVIHNSDSKGQLNDIDDLDKTLKAIFLFEDEPERIKTREESIDKLVEIGSEDAMRVLVNHWVRWIAVRNSITLANMTEKKIRAQEVSVRPLVERLENTFDERIINSDPELWNTIIWEVAIDEKENRVEVDKNFSTSTMGIYEQKYKEKINLKWRNRQLEVRKQISHLLVEMSLTMSPEKWESYLPQLTRLLTNETNQDLRGGIAQIFGNIRSNNSIAAMINALSGQDQRSGILDKYYLQPSQHRSEAAAKTLSDVSDRAKDTLKVTQILNIVVFGIGVVVLAAGLVGGIFIDNIGARFASVIAGLGGLTGVIFYLIKDPLNRIQNAMSNLAQIETAFNTYIWEMNLSDTFIQSQYLANGILTEDEIAQTARRIEGVSCSTLNQIEIFTELGKENQCGQIMNIYPPVGQAGTEVTIKGQFNLLKGEKNARGQIIAFNHKQKLADLTSNDIKADEIKFTLPDNIISSDTPETVVWVSIVTDSGLTNPYPLQITNKTK
jgi:hypothetical protein